jgi:hypothetical protein
MNKRCENTKIVDKKTAEYLAVSDILLAHTISPVRPTQPSSL